MYISVSARGLKFKYIENSLFIKIKILMNPKAKLKYKNDNSKLIVFFSSFFFNIILKNTDAMKLNMTLNHTIIV